MSIYFCVFDSETYSGDNNEDGDAYLLQQCEYCGCAGTCNNEKNVQTSNYILVHIFIIRSYYS